MDPHRATSTPPSRTVPCIVPFLHGGVVNDFHWLDERQFLDAVAVAMITPLPRPRCSSWSRRARCLSRC